MAPNLPKKIRVPVHGVLLLDKAAGQSSNDALIKAKRLFNAQKAGHTGTLDPFATGLLPLCFGEATKFAQDLLDADKTYETIVHLGITTETGDTEGRIIDQRQVNISSAQVEDALAQLRGEIAQVPPMYSALKRDGKPLYEYARAGIVLEREARRVVIRSLECLGQDGPYLKLRVTCSKGTYIRVLGEDIGKLLGCGAHLQLLRRTAVGSLDIAQAVTLDALSALQEDERVSRLAGIDTLLSNCPRVDLPEALAKRFLHGQRIALGKEGLSVSFASGRVRAYSDSGQLLGTAQLLEYAVLAPERLISATG